MNKSTKFLMLAGVTLASLAVPAAAETDTGICSDDTTVIGPPAGGEIGLWANDCIVLSATSAVITFTTIDALPHRPVANGCFDLGNIGAGASKTVSLNLLGSFVRNGAAVCSTSTIQPRDGTFIPRRETDIGPVIVANEDGSKTIHYICAIHGAAMHGTITLGKAA